MPSDPTLGRLISLITACSGLYKPLTADHYFPTTTPALTLLLHSFPDYELTAEGTLCVIRRREPGEGWATLSDYE